MGSSSVDCRLYFLETWLKHGLFSLKVHIDFEEWLQDLLGSVSAAANSFLHLVERIFGCVEEGLIHGPVVVLAQLLNFLSGDGFNMLVKLVRANCLDKVFNSSFNFVVLASEFLALNCDPLLLHLDESVKSVGH